MAKDDDIIDAGRLGEIRKRLGKNLPEKWELTTLGETFKWGSGGTPKRTDPRYYGGDIPWLIIGDLNDGVVNESETNITEEGLTDSSAKWVESGSVLLAMYGSIGKLGIAGRRLTTNQAIAFTKPDPVDAKYLFYYLQYTRGDLASLGKGATQKNISQTVIKAFPFVLAPQDQQKRIVAEIEKQFSRLDEAVANLKRVKANLKRYKAAVLKAAVEGRLVETEAEIARREGRSLPTPRPGVFYVYAIRCNDDSIYVGHTDNLARRWEEHLAGQAADWTMQHKPMQIVHYEEYSSRQEASDREKWLKTGYGRKWIKREIEAGRARQVGYETGEQLLQRILETRRSQWLASAEQAGRKGKGKYKEPAAPDTTNLPELPEGWVWGTFGHLCRIQGGFAFKSADYMPQGVPLVRISNLVNGSVQLEEDTVFLPDRFLSEFADFRLEKGDTLIAMSGATTGKMATFALESPALLNQRVGRFKPTVPALTVAGYVSFLAMQASGKVLTEAYGAAQPNISPTEIEAMPVGVPPLSEQNRIVAEVDRHLSLTRETEGQVDANLQRAERLRQSILAAAFFGVLLGVGNTDLKEAV